jgi:hypothetical protein
MSAAAAAVPKRRRRPAAPSKAKQSKQPKQQQQQGGKHLANGTYGCVFSPPISCANQLPKTRYPDLYDRGVGKLFFEAPDKTEEAALVRRLVDAVDPAHAFTAPLRQECRVAPRPPEAAAIRAHCGQQGNLEHQLVYAHGGRDWLDVVKKTAARGAAAGNKAAVFLRLFGSLTHVFPGLQRLYRDLGHVHHDIKPGNLLYDPRAAPAATPAAAGAAAARPRPRPRRTGSARLVDWGLATPADRVYDRPGILAAAYPYFPTETKVLRLVQRKQGGAALPDAGQLAALHAAALSRAVSHWRAWYDAMGIELQPSLARFLAFLAPHAAQGPAALRAHLETLLDRFDVYSLGVSLLEVAHRLWPQGPPQHALGPAPLLALTFVRDCLQPNPYERPTLAAAVQRYAQVVQALRRGK